MKKCGCGLFCPKNQAECAKCRKASISRQNILRSHRVASEDHAGMNCGHINVQVQAGVMSEVLSCKSDGTRRSRSSYATDRSSRSSAVSGESSMVSGSEGVGDDTYADPGEDGRHEDVCRGCVQFRSIPSLVSFDVVDGASDTCINCHRCECHDGFDGLPEYGCILSVVGLSELRPSLRKWRLFGDEDCGGYDDVVLCLECFELLSVESHEERDGKPAGWHCQWPAYCWSLLSSSALHDRMGCSVLQLLPRQWWGHWIKELNRLFQPVFGASDIDWHYRLVESCVVEVTLKRSMLFECRRELRLGRIKRVLDSLLIPVVLCPWGCSCYFHDNGSIGFDEVMHRYLGAVGLCGSVGRNRGERVESAREDFLDSNHSMHLFNPLWKVLPSVYYQEGVGPVFMTCSEHSGGTLEQYFHLPKNTIGLPSRQAECLSSAVLRTRTLRPSMPRKYSNGYRLQKCLASYCGVDTAVVSEDRHFDYTSHIEDLNESKCFKYRSDIQGTALDLAATGSISSDYMRYLRSRSDGLFVDEVVERENKGTMMCLKDALRLQRWLAKSDVEVVMSDEAGVNSVSFRPNWPSVLIYVHPNNLYGAKISVPSMMRVMSKDSCECLLSFWVLSVICSCVPEIWENLHAQMSRRSDWRGFFLSYLARKVTRQSVAIDKKRNPFYVNESHELITPRGLNKKIFGSQNNVFPMDVANVMKEGLSLDGRMVRIVDICTKDWVKGLSNGEPCDGSPKYIFGIVNCWLGVPAELVEYGGCKYELRVLVLHESIYNPRSLNIWSCECWRRHGGVFSSWWVCKRTPSRCIQWKAQSLVGCDTAHLRILVYVLLDDKSDGIAVYQRDYLDYIGGQGKCMCQNHGLPLVTAASLKRGHGRKCSQKCIDGIVCSNVAVYECSIESCGVCICKQCFEDGAHSGGKIFVAKDSETSQQLCFGNTSNNSDHCVADDSNVVIGADFREANLDERSNCDDGESINDTFDMLHTGCDAPMFDLEHCGDEEEAIEDEGNCIMQSTHFCAKEDRFHGNLGTMGTSVLLNKFGTILVRRDNRLQASRREQNLIERVVSRRSTGSIPLVWLEGMLFPSIFWSHPHDCGGGLLGAIPTALLCQHKTRARFRVASLASHAKVRLKSVASTACSNPFYLSFLFDSLANGALEGNDTRVVLSRGFEETMGPAGMRMRNGEDDFYTDTIDNRQNCHNLCASEREKRSALFVTLTCNQREHFGVRQVKRYVDSDACFENYRRMLESQVNGPCPISAQQETEIRFALQEAARNLIVRNWMEVRVMLIRYILKSPEKPLGKIEKIFVRDEYQSESGNLSHLHMLLTLEEDYGTPDGREYIEGLIRGFVDEIVGADEVPGLIEEGLLDSWEDYYQMKDDAKRILGHSCDSHRCLRRTGPGPDDVKCRVPDTRKLSKDLTRFSEVKYDILHERDVLELYEQLGFCEKQEENGGKFVSQEEFLNPKRILPPARFGEGIITPVVGRLFAATRSSMNIQICTGFGTSRYLVKCITKIDENNYVVFSVNQENPSAYKVEVVNLHNTKIASSAINEKKRIAASRHRGRPRGRAIASTEMMQIILGYPQVYTNVEYIKVPTLPLGDRPGLERKSPKERWKEECKRAESSGGLVPDMYEFCLPYVSYRKKLSARSRWFTANQEMMLTDQIDSPVTVDRVTIFGARPPELLCIDKMEWYFRVFVRVDLPDLADKDTRRAQFDRNVSNSLQCSWWVDGFGSRVLIRWKGIAVLKQILESDWFKTRRVLNKYKESIGLLTKIVYYWEESEKEQESDSFGCGLPRGQALEWSKLRSKFVDLDELRGLRLPIPVFSNVRPRNATKFIVHLLLSMGHFETEADLWGHFDIKEAFMEAGILTSQRVEDVCEEDCVHVLRSWILDQCQYYPISSRALDSYACSAMSILRGALLDGSIPVDELPPCLYTRLFKSRTDKTMSHRAEIRAALTQATLNGLRGAFADSGNNLPSFDRIQAVTDKGFGDELEFCKSSVQSDASFQEQLGVYNTCVTAMQNYKQPSTVACKGTIIVGPPGAGKTHCLLHSVLFALCEGLTCITTAILAERALLLGGQHFHLLFKLKVRDAGYKVHRMAELAVVSLQKNPESLAFLRSLDALFVDEMGQLSAELLSVLDIIMRRIRDSSLFMGGVLIIGTLDQLQLRPIKELPFLISPYIMTCFQMTKLRYYVRCADCCVLQEMNELARFYCQEEEVREEKLTRFRELVADNCTFVDAWTDDVLGDGVLRVFPKKRQALLATNSFLAEKRREVLQQGGLYLSCKAKDTMVPLESHGEWKEASSQVVAYLNKQVLEPERLDFYVGAIYQFTYNQKKRFSTTQLAVLLDMPSVQDLEAHRPIKVWAAPPGTKVIDIQGRSSDELEELGWSMVYVSVAPEFSRTIWSQGVKAKRRQYGLKHHVASTVHAAIGHTMYKVATELTLQNGIWERAMVVVLISRVRKASDIIFVGDKRENLDALLEGLRIRCQYDDYMNHLVDVLCGISSTETMQIDSRLSLHHHPFRPRDVPLPLDSSGVVYLLVSMKNGNLYVGHTQNLARRLKQHNSGYGSSSTSDPLLRPWALAAYVCGFGGNRSVMRCFESEWQQKNAFHCPKRASVSIGYASDLCCSEKYAEWKLVVVDQVAGISRD